MQKKLARSINIPLSDVRCLYRKPRSHKVVCEIDLTRFQSVNDNLTIDEMFGEAELEYAAGLTSGFTDTKRLMSYLKA